MKSLDPHPRSYPDGVTLLRRSEKVNVVQGVFNLTDIQEWLLTESIGVDDMLLLFKGLVGRLLGLGLSFERISLHVGTLDPELLGFYWLWTHQDSFIDELKVSLEGYQTQRYSRSPLKIVIDTGSSFFARTDNTDDVEKFPLLDDLKKLGIKAYCILPMGSGQQHHNALTFSTKYDAGFDKNTLETLNAVLKIFALHVERNIATTISRNIVNTYLGRVAGEKVISGSIQRGSGDSIRSVIWMSDLRGFTLLSDTLPGEVVLSILNVYFECLVETITDHGGEILKFIGDGLLAVFPIDKKHESARKAVKASVGAAREILKKLNTLHFEIPEDHNLEHGLKSLQTGIGLHIGEVFFGNMGAPGRLDFTVIGKAVNEVSRVKLYVKN